MAQSRSLEAFFAPEGELDDLFAAAFPVSLGVHDLTYCGLAVTPLEESGDDFLQATFRIMSWDASRTQIENIVEQQVALLWLAPAVEDDVYRVAAFRLFIPAETVKARLRRFVRGLPGRATARFARINEPKSIIPDDVL